MGCFGRFVWRPIAMLTCCLSRGHKTPPLEVLISPRFLLPPIRQGKLLQVCVGSHLTPAHSDPGTKLASVGVACSEVLHLAPETLGFLPATTLGMPGGQPRQWLRPGCAPALPVGEAALLRWRGGLSQGHRRGTFCLSAIPSQPGLQEGSKQTLSGLLVFSSSCKPTAWAEHVSWHGLLVELRRPRWAACLPASLYF